MPERYDGRQALVPVQGACRGQEPEAPLPGAEKDTLKGGTMKTHSAVAAVSLCLASLAFAAEKQMRMPAGMLDTARIEALTGAKGTLDAKEGVFKVSVPRKGLSVIIAGVKMSPPMGLTSWAAFKRDGKDDMVMGDMVMTENQVSPVMSAALDNGLEVTALHNHFIWDSPRIMFMHIGGMGPEQDLAASVGRVFAKINETSGKTGSPDAQIDPARSSLDPAKLDSALGVVRNVEGRGSNPICSGSQSAIFGDFPGAS
jgi:hypothetical protein